MQFHDFVQWVFYGVIGGSTVFGVSILRSLNQSVAELNVRFATLMEKTLSHEKAISANKEEIKEQEERIRALELKRRA